MPAYPAAYDSGQGQLCPVGDDERQYAGHEGGPYGDGAAAGGVYHDEPQSAESIAQQRAQDQQQDVVHMLFSSQYSRVHSRKPG